MIRWQVRGGVQSDFIRNYQRRGRCYWKTIYKPSTHTGCNTSSIEMIQKKKISLVVNGKVVQSAAVPGISLASFLHENLGLTGTKVACAMGICKACTVALKDEKTNSISRLQACITPVESINGRSVLTVEGIEYEARFKPLQEAFLKHFSFQCGYCTPGFLLGASLLIDQLRLNPVKADQLDQLILEGVGDHICRCSGYSRYYSAIKEVILKTSGLTLS